MNIKQLFPDNLISSTEFNVPTTDALRTTEVGPISISGMTLTETAQNTKVANLTDSANAGHARPTMFAHISSFADHVKTAVGQLAANGLNGPNVLNSLKDKAPDVYADFVEWQGMIAAVALNNIYSSFGLNLSVSAVNLDITGNTNNGNDENRADENATKLRSIQATYRCILAEMKKDLVYCEALIPKQENAPITGGTLYYICQNDVPFAVYHPEIGLAAMKQYDPSIFTNVLSWYRGTEENCHANWKPLIGGSNGLDDFCRARIAWWCNQNDNPSHSFRFSQYADYIQPVGYNLPNGLDAPVLKDSGVINNTWAGQGTRFGTSLAFYKDSNNLVHTLPQLFLDNIFLSYVGDPSRNHFIYRAQGGDKPVQFSAGNPQLDSFAPVPPFRREMAPLLTECTLSDITFNVKMNTSLESITVVVHITTPKDESVSLSKVYDRDHICQGRVPYMMVWPFIPLPKDMPDLWKRYYSTWQDMTGNVPPNTWLADSNGRTYPQKGSMSFDFEAQGTASEISTHNTQNHWTVCTSSHPFRYAIVTEKKDNGQIADLGMVFIPTQPLYSKNDDGIITPGTDNPIKLSIDFGTTSTVCALHHPAAFAGISKSNIVDLPFKDYSKAVTCDDEGASRTIQMQHWQGCPEGANIKNWKWDSKIFSIAQLLDRTDPATKSPAICRTANTVGAEQRYYEDGRLLLISPDSLSDFISTGPSIDDPLLNRYVMNDMKFNEKENELNIHAADIYLAGLYLYAVLFLLDHKIIPTAGQAFIKLLVSYPNQIARNSLTDRWHEAQAILNTIMDSSLCDAASTPTFYTEATAASAYMESRGFIAANDSVSVDIGGGTTDISITHKAAPNKIRKLSIRYAGREIMVSSIIQYLRRFHPSNAQDQIQFLNLLWPSPDLNNLRTTFLTIAGQADNAPTLCMLPTNNSLRMDIELLLSKGMHLDNLALNKTNLLRELIVTKWTMLLRIIARTISKNMDMWLVNGKYEILNEKLQFHLVINGTSAQMLQYIFNHSMSELATLLTDPLNLVEDEKVRACRELINRLFEDELGEKLQGAHADVIISASQEPAKKLEVCHGMLTEQIKNFQTTNSSQASQETDSRSVNEMQRELSLYPAEAFQEYLGTRGEDGHYKNGLLHYLEEYHTTFYEGQPKGNCGLGYNVQSAVDLLKNWQNYYAQVRQYVQQYNVKNLLAPEFEDYRDLLIGMYLTEECLNESLATLQTHPEMQN